MKSALLALLLLLLACGGGTKSVTDTPVTADVPTEDAEGKPGAPLAAILGQRGAIEATLLDGKRVELRDFGAPVTVIAMWATYCKPCIEELPHIEALHQKYANDPNVSVIAVNIDEVDEPEQLARVKATVTKLGLSLPVLVNGHGIMRFLVPPDADGKQQVGLPMVAIIDRELTVRREVGFPQGITEEAYLGGKVQLIDVALAGELHKLQEHDATMEAPPSGAELKVDLPKMSDEELAAFLPQFRAQMKKAFPAFTDAALDKLVEDARAASQSGKPLVFVVP
jgi:thiol-disulfide isomerase/thioredoxin